MVEPYKKLKYKELCQGMLALTQLERLKMERKYEELKTGALAFRRSSLYELSEKLNLAVIELNQQRGIKDDVVTTNLSVVYREMGRYDESLQLLNRDKRYADSNEASCMGQLRAPEFNDAVEMAVKINETNNSHTTKLRCAELFIRKGMIKHASDIIEELENAWSVEEDWWYAEYLTIKCRLRYEAFRGSQLARKHDGNNELSLIQKLANKAFAIRKKRLGDVSCDTINSLEILAEMEEWKGNMDAALEMFEFIWRIREYLLGHNHQMVLLAECRYFETLCIMGKTEPINAIFKISEALKSISLILKAGGNDRTAEIHARLASCHLIHNDIIEACSNYQKAIDIQSAIASKKHWKVKYWQKLQAELFQNN